jgi:hypothetical protein
MDTPTDFKFLEENIAIKYNPNFGEKEYLVIQAYPLRKSIRVVYRSYNYQEAEQFCNLENLSSDYSSFVTRIYHNDKLWTPEAITGIPYRISEQQFWEIHPNYETINANNIQVCGCSYPYFSWNCQLITCLKDNHARPITLCPNCGSSLIENEETDDDDFIPSACRGCSNYDGEFYEGNQLICAIHPYGWNDENCPDFSAD